MQKWCFIYTVCNLISKGVLRAALISLSLQMIYLLIYHKFIYGHGTVVQPASINIVFGCKQAQQYSRTHQLCFIRAVI